MLYEAVLAEELLVAGVALEEVQDAVQAVFHHDACTTSPSHSTEFAFIIYCSAI